MTVVKNILFLRLFKVLQVHMNKLISNRFITSLTLIYVTIFCFSATISTSANSENIGGSCIFKTPGNPGSTCPAPTPTNANPASALVPTAVGNPINALTGNKFQQESDIQAVGDTYA